MIDTLYNNTITLPNQAFHNIVTQRKELIITTLTLETSAQKVRRHYV